MRGGAPLLISGVARVAKGRHAMEGRHRPLGSAAEEAAAMWSRFALLLTGLMVASMLAPLLDTLWCVVRLLLAGAGLTCLTLFINAEARAERARGGSW